MNKPIPSLGGKTFSVKALREMLPYHNTYVEVFGGGASLMFAKEPSYKEIYNDIDDLLHNFFIILRDRPKDFYEYLEATPISRKLFEENNASIKSGKLWWKSKLLELPDLERAVIFYIIKKHSFGNKCQSFNPQKDICTENLRPQPEDVAKFSMRLKNVFIEHKDFEYILKNYDDPHTLFYLDPPYWKTEQAYAVETWPGEEHMKLRDALLSLSGRFLLSYNNIDIIKDMYRNFNIYEIDTRNTITIKDKDAAVTELAITNYKV